MTEVLQQEADVTALRKECEQLAYERNALRGQVNALQGNVEQLQEEARAQGQRTAEALVRRDEVHQARVKELNEALSRAQLHANAGWQKHDTLLRALYEEAEARDWCDEFDTKMEELGYDGRERERTVTVSANVEIEFSFMDDTKAVTFEVEYVEHYTSTSADGAVEQAQDEAESYLEGQVDRAFHSYESVRFTDIEAEIDA